MTSLLFHRIRVRFLKWLKWQGATPFRITRIQPWKTWKSWALLFEPSWNTKYLEIRHRNRPDNYSGQQTLSRWCYFNETANKKNKSISETELAWPDVPSTAVQKQCHQYWTDGKLWSFFWGRSELCTGLFCFVFFVITIAYSSIEQPFFLLSRFVGHQKIERLYIFCVLFQLQCIGVVWM